MKKNVKKILPFIIIIILSLIIEVFVFNFRSFSSISYTEKKCDNYTLGKGIKKDKGVHYIVDKDKAYIEIKKINKEVKVIKLDIDVLNKSNYLIYDIYATDEANQYYYKLPTRYLYSSITKSKYINLNLSGEAKNLKIMFNHDQNDNLSFKINGIYINSSIPLDFSFTRYLIMVGLLILIYVFRPNSPFYSIKLDFKKKYQVIIFLLLFVIEAFVMFYYMRSNKIMFNLSAYSNQFQYQELAIALSKGKVSLDIDASKKLKKMKNPYDYGARNKEQVAFEWDKSYYKGKYYVYFGVVPVAFSYLPYYMITGKSLPTYVVIYGISLLSMIGMFLLLKEIVKRFFPNTKLLIFIVFLAWLVNCSGLLSILGCPTLYNVSILFALMFTYFGLYFWYSSIKEDRFSKWRLFIGSLCMALVAGCRPQFLVGSFLAIPIFWSKLFKEKKFFNKKIIGEILSFVIPYIVIAILLMLYNNIRFGSPFDFGANYNLTGNDMTRRGFNVDRIGLGIFSYLFQLPSITATFPFLESSTFSTNYMGTTIFEEQFGGLIVTNLLLILSLLLPRFKKKVPKQLFVISLMCIIFAFVVIILDTEMAGLLPRYKSDFAWLFFLPTIFILLSLFHTEKLDNYLKIFLEISLVIIFISFVYQFLYMFDDQLLHNLVESSTAFYFKWYYLLQWWL